MKLEPLSELPYVRHIMSAGGHCVVASVLNKNGLRRFSGPFDWIFSNSGMIQHCIEDDFVKFLDIKYYYPNENPALKSNVFDEGRFPIHHSFYEQTFPGGRPVFNHHDLLDPEAYNSFARSVDRFRLLSNCGIRTQLVQCLYFHESDVQSRFSKIVGDFHQIAGSLDFWAPSMYLSAFAVSWAASEAELPVLEKLSQSGSHRLMALRPVMQMGPMEFQSPLDEALWIKSVIEHSPELREPWL